MDVKMAVGGEFFDRIRQNKSYYVDKTELIYELVHENDNMVSLFTRPRRFGKTLMMSMMESFLIFVMKEVRYSAVYQYIHSTKNSAKSGCINFRRY